MSLGVELQLPHGEVLVRVLWTFESQNYCSFSFPNNNYRGKPFEDAALVDPVLRALPLWNTPNKNRGDQKGQACCVATFGRGGVGEAMPVLTCHE